MPTKLKSVSERSGEHDAVVCGRGKICGCDTALFFMDANFMMGSMGSVVGEKICRTFERATELGIASCRLYRFGRCAHARGRDIAYADGQDFCGG